MPRVRGQQARASGEKLKLPPIMLNFELYGEQKLALHELYPQNAVYQESDIDKLRMRLVRLEKDYAQLQAKAASKDIGYWVNLAGRYVARKFVGKRRQ